MADIRFVKEIGSLDQTDGNEASHRQSQLDNLQPGKDFRSQMPKHNKEQSQCSAWDVCLKDQNSRRVELSKVSDTSGGHGQ